jgi:hypothetical protein
MVALAKWVRPILEAMTFTLSGRWQSRVFLLGALGLPLTAVFAWLYGSLTPFALLAYVLLFGLGWDVLYQCLQSLRWNRDWPPLFAWVAGLWEGVFLWLALRLYGLVGVSSIPATDHFTAHYLAVFCFTWVASHSLLPILFPRWRFCGGQWLSGWQ